jgi:hypothetical protein
MKVSALVSLYKASSFVDSCLADLVGQSLFRKGQLEIVVIDSASPEDERRIVEDYQRRYENIVYIRTEDRERLYQAWNRGIKACRGAYITNANADDRHHPECLEILSRSLDAHPDVQLVYSDVFESQTPNEPFEQNARSICYRYPEYFSPEALLHYQFGCQPMWRKTVHASIGYFSDEMVAAGDWEFNIRFAMAGLRARHVPIVLGSFLQRPTSISQQNDTSGQEQVALRKRYLTVDNILSLYAREGMSARSPADKAAALTDFARRAMSLRLPWEPGRTFVDGQAALLCCAQAFDLAQDEPRVAWNLGVALQCVAQPGEAQRYLQKAVAARHPEIEKVIEHVQNGMSLVLPIVPLTPHGSYRSEGPL